MESSAAADSSKQSGPGGISKKEILKKRNKAWRQNNPDIVRKWRRDFYHRHKDRLKIERKDYFESRKLIKAEYDRKYSKRNRKRIASRLNGYRLINRGILKFNLKEWREKYRDRYNARQRERRKSDPQFGVAGNLRGRINTALRFRGLRREIRLTKLIGCSIPELVRYLESKFLPGMTWENRRLWHIDHIRPCASFDLTDLEQQKICFHFRNLQPLWAKDNLAKSDRYVPDPS